MNIKPKRFAINLIFECPTCGGSHWYSSKELKNGGILYCCGETNVISPINNVEVTIKFKKNVPQEALDILTGYGYDKKEIESAISNMVSYDNAEDFVRQFLSSQI